MLKRWKLRVEAGGQLSFRDSRDATRARALASRTSRWLAAMDPARLFDLGETCVCRLKDWSVFGLGTRK
jgi:hypothetical protein